MSLFNKSSRPEKPKDTSIFRGKPYLQRGELREALKKAPLNVPGGGQLFRKERIEMEKGFGKKFGPLIDTKDYDRRLKELAKEKAWGKTGAERTKADRQIRFLKNLRKP